MVEINVPPCNEMPTSCASLLGFVVWVSCWLWAPLMSLLAFLTATNMQLDHDFGVCSSNVDSEYEEYDGHHR